MQVSAFIKNDQRLLKTLKQRRLTIYGEQYAHKISEIDIF
jgi:hypothetical protein